MKTSDRKRTRHPTNPRKLNAFFNPAICLLHIKSVVEVGFGPYLHMQKELRSPMSILFKFFLTGTTEPVSIYDKSFISFQQPAKTAASGEHTLRIDERGCDTFSFAINCFAADLCWVRKEVCWSGGVTECLSAL
jgi:hypothetical protein